ncbi:hypothetical protein ACQP3D_29845, partial [Escherichia coli]
FLGRFIIAVVSFYSLLPSEITKSTKQLLMTQQAAPILHPVSLPPPVVVFKASPAQNAETANMKLCCRQPSASSP